MSKKNAKLTEVFKEIRKQTGYDFVFPKDLLKEAKNVSIQVKNADLTEVLEICFKSQPFTYKISNKVIVVFSENLAESPVKVIRKPELINLRGRVVNDEGEPLENATVRAKGNLRAATTDQDGVFYIEDIETGTELSISYVGYRTTTVSVAVGLKEIRLSVNKSSLDEVKVIAYGTTTSRKSTGDVSTITAEDIARQPVSDALQALQGKVPGLVVKSTGGFFSGNYNVKIRGNNSLPLDGLTISDPLYVIDGVPLTAGSGDGSGRGLNQNLIAGPAGGQNPLLYLNPSDIESISVLKDADATALYGSRGANGVILITTKKAKPGKTQVDVNVFTGYSQQSKKLNLMNTQQYLTMRREALKNDGLTADPGLDYDLSVWDSTRNVNWQKQLL